MSATWALVTALVWGVRRSGVSKVWASRLLAGQKFDPVRLNQRPNATYSQGRLNA